MKIEDLDKLKSFTAGDQTELKEFFNPAKEDLALRYSLAHATVKPGQTTLNHRLKTSEVYYILCGEGVMYIDNESKTVKEGQAIYIPPGSIQRIRNTLKTPLRFLCIVDPAWRPEDEEILGETT